MDWLKEVLKNTGIDEEKLEGIVTEIGKELAKRFIPKDKYNEVAQTKQRLEADLV